MGSPLWRALCQKGLQAAFFSSVFCRWRQNDSSILSDFLRAQTRVQWGCQRHSEWQNLPSPLRKQRLVLGIEFIVPGPAPPRKLCVPLKLTKRRPQSSAGDASSGRSHAPITTYAQSPGEDTTRLTSDPHFIWGIERQVLFGRGEMELFSLNFLE